MNLTRTSAAELGALIARGEVSAVEVTQAHLDRILRARLGPGAAPPETA